MISSAMVTRSEQKSILGGEAQNSSLAFDFERCYAISSARDPRFDGRFVMAVSSTGIYCRPSCPAVTPKRENVSFHPSGAAAQQLGYRACLRCRPEAAPGTPEWDLRASVAGRALRLISDGVVERDGVSGLAERMGYSERQLGRVLTAELGAGAQALARAHRARTALLLIQGGGMSMTEVAFASGFGSLRQFNDTVAKVFGRTPTQLREQSSSSAARIPAGVGGEVNLKLAFRSPFDQHATLQFLSRRDIDGVEGTGQGTDDTYARTLRLPNGPAQVWLSPGEQHIQCRLKLSELRDLGPAVARCRRLLDLDADSVAVDQALATDPALAGLVGDRPGVRVPQTVDGFEIAVRAILGQQVSVAAARTQATRLVRLCGEQLSWPQTKNSGEDAAWLFPTPDAVASLPDGALAMPAARQRALVALANAVARGEIDLNGSQDPAEARQRLLALPGIGPWTADYICMRALGDTDVLLSGDLGVRQGAEAVGLPATASELTERGESWSPWRSYVNLHLWAAAPTPAEKRKRSGK